MNEALVALQVARAAIAALEAAQALGVNARELADVFEKARASGEGISDDQIRSMAARAHAAVDRL